MYSIILSMLTLTGIAISLAPSSLYASTPRFNTDDDFYTYIGGNNNESAYAIAIDSRQNIFIAGETNSNYFDSYELAQNKIHFNQNCFIVKIGATSELDDFYYEFAGSKRETCREIALDSQDNIYLTGETQSNDLPITTDTQFSGEWDAFLLKLNNNGELKYATYLGGALTDYGHGLVVKSVDQVYVAGETWSIDFPTTENAFMPECKLFTACNGSKANAFLTHINTSDPNIFASEYSSYIGGSNQDKAHDLAIDQNGHLHIVGETRSNDFPLNKQIQDSLNGTYDGFLTIINPSAYRSKSLTMSTYLGGSSDDFIFSVTTDLDGSSYLTGETWSDNFPSSNNAFASSCAKGYALCNTIDNTNRHSDAFISIVSHSTNTEPKLLYSSLFGGSSEDVAQDILVENNKVLVSGFTWSSDFPVTTNAYRSVCNEKENCEDFSDGFIIEIDLDKTNDASLVYSSYIGGNNHDTIFSFAKLNNSNSLSNESNGNSKNKWEIFVTGETYTSNLASISTIDGKQKNGDAFLQKLSITGQGSWIDKRHSKDSQPSKRVLASAIDYPILIFLFLAIFLYKYRGYI